MRASIAPARLLAGMMTMIIAVSVVIPLIHPGQARAFSLLSQNDWSGGVGSDPTYPASPSTNQFTSQSGLVTNTPGQLALDTSGGSYSNWCNTAQCDSNWTRREAINIDTTTGTYAEFVQELDVPYRDSMMNGFNDVRFVSEDGATDLSYYNAANFYGSHARMLVKIPAAVGGSAVWTLSRILPCRCIFQVSAGKQPLRKQWRVYGG